MERAALICSSAGVGSSDQGPAVAGRAGYWWDARGDGNTAGKIGLYTRQVVGKGPPAARGKQRKHGGRNDHRKRPRGGTDWSAPSGLVIKRATGETGMTLKYGNEARLRDRLRGRGRRQEQMNGFVMDRGETTD